MRHKKKIFYCFNKKKLFVNFAAVQMVRSMLDVSSDLTEEKKGILENLFIFLRNYMGE